MKYKKIVSHPFVLVVLLGIILRFIFLFFFDAPAFHNDSEGYMQLAQRLLKFDLSEYEGRRTPGYPFLLMLSGFNYFVVVFLQVVLSICSIYFVYDIISNYSKRYALSTSLFLISLLNCISFEFSILTEVLTQFVLLFSLWYIYKHKLLTLDKKWKYYIQLALVLLLLFFVRPMYILLPPILFFFHVFKLKRRKWKIQLSKACLVLLFPFIGYFGWGYLNYINQSWFTITTFYGINLSQNSYGFIDKLPDEHIKLKEIYISNKEVQIYDSLKHNSLPYLINYYFKQTNDAMTIWKAHPELLEYYNVSRPQLSKKMSVIFKELIVNNPTDYFAQVFRSWTHFWNHYQYFMVLGDHVKELIFPIKIMWKSQKLILILANLLFFPISILALFLSIKNRNLFNYSNLIIAIVYASSISQALVTYGENARFAFPTFYLIIGFVVIALSKIKLVEQVRKILHK